MHKATHIAKAFTIVELMVVVAVLSLLIALLLPALSLAKGAAESTKAMVASRTLGQAYLHYAAEHNDQLMPAYLADPEPGQPDPVKGVLDEFGNELAHPVSHRWVYRLAPYFNFGWEGATNVGERAELLDRYHEIVTEEGLERWPYYVSIFPSFGINWRYMGGNLNNPAWTAQRYHVRRLGDASQSSNLIVFASSRFVAGPTRADGYMYVDPPPLDGVFEESLPTTTELGKFGYVHPRYQGRAMVSFLDGHAGPLSEKELLDRRHWANPAAKRSEPDWEP